MRSFGLNRWAAVAVFALTALLAAGSAFATPNPNSAVLHTRVFNDCPISILSTLNTYPGLIMIDDQMDPLCLGFANRHNWSFSVDGVNPVDFLNYSNFRFGADVVMTGNGFGEGGLRVSPWWSLDVDGVFMLNDQSGEIACFGGRLPFYTFTGNGVPAYVKGTVAHMEIVYLANGLNSVSPATIEYRLTINSTPYTSGPLAFDEGNPAEAIHGLWGMLEPTWVGGYTQAYAAASAGGNVHVEWSNIFFQNLDGSVPVRNSSWGHLKNLYR